MLVCNVSLRPPRSAIAAEVVEITAAVDALATGNVVFATLVDDPASVRETVDAYLGEIMLEAATASDVADASIPGVYAADITETVSAVDGTDASASVPTITWDSATAHNVTLSGGNLVVTNTGGSSGDQGARGADAVGKTTGKYYFEITLTANGGGGNTGLGIGTITSTYTAMGNNATTGTELFMAGSIYTNGSNSGTSFVSLSGATIIGVAIDLTNRKAWFRHNGSFSPGLWNGNASYDPVTNVGGVTIPSGTMVPFCTFNASGSVYTANFGASAFSGGVPSGFTAGWPA